MLSGVSWLKHVKTGLNDAPEDWRDRQILHVLTRLLHDPSRPVLPWPARSHNDFKGTCQRWWHELAFTIRDNSRTQLR